jgi:hypothetical protein
MEVMSVPESRIALHLAEVKVPWGGIYEYIINKASENTMTCRENAQKIRKSY